MHGKELGLEHVLPVVSRLSSSPRQGRASSALTTPAGLTGGMPETRVMHRRSRPLLSSSLAGRAMSCPGHSPVSLRTLPSGAQEPFPAGGSLSWSRWEPTWP